MPLSPDIDHSSVEVTIGLKDEEQEEEQLLERKPKLTMQQRRMMRQSPYLKKAQQKVQVQSSADLSRSTSHSEVELSDDTDPLSPVPVEQDAGTPLVEVVYQNTPSRLLFALFSMSLVLGLLRVMGVIGWPVITLVLPAISLLFDYFVLCVCVAPVILVKHFITKSDISSLTYIYYRFVVNGNDSTGRPRPFQNHISEEELQFLTALCFSCTNQVVLLALQATQAVSWSWLFLLFPTYTFVAAALLSAVEPIFVPRREHHAIDDISRDTSAVHLDPL